MAAAEEAEKAVQEANKAAAGSSSDRQAAALKIDGYTRDQLLELLLEHTRRSGTSAQLVTLLREKAAAAAGEDLHAVAPEPREGEPPAEPKDYGISWVEAGDEAAAYRSPEGDAARSALESARSDVTKLEDELRTAKEEEGTDYGPDAAFYKLKGSCVELKVNQYTYSVCPFGSAKQDYTTLGSFSGWGKTADGSADYSKMLFTGERGIERCLHRLITIACYTTVSQSYFQSDNFSLMNL